ncbi:OsmC family peroxiredoxin [Corallococcus praedator]|uniref:OsmC family peroxiredoxin n=1 Tax=Corallococcus praedator TaxID=2316724 RepID=A0ABX9QH64_9BACT|nr:MULTISPECIES: OsmC family protein [Corallococcus]RKH33259.1 OsmC family peroxiredoxin [Corallococcus sp. CA031C]RKI07078.1 OsmC family peroxiredoxin [Corallococcus praedator]
MANAPDSILLSAATVESGEGLTQHIRTGHHQFTADEPVARGGADQGPAPYQLLLGSLGACTAITLKMYAEKKKWDLGKLVVRLKLIREPAGERVERVLDCADTVTPEQRARLLEISAKTPVTLTLSRALHIDTRFASTEPSGSAVPTQG